MKIKAFSLERDSYASADTKAAITDLLTEGGVFFESFSQPDRLFAEISASLKDSDAVLIGVETQLYLKFKPILIKAFNFTPAYSEKTEKRIGSRITDEKLLKAHMLVPNECSELLSEDGLYSAFYVKSDLQYIVVFPLKSDSAVSMLTSGDLPFFMTVQAKSAGSGMNKTSEKAQDIVTKLLKNDIKLAVPSTPAAALLKEEIKNCPNYENNVFFTPFVNDDGETDAKNYSAQLARGAMELRSADIGATVSNIFREKDGDTVKTYYAFISAAIGEKVIVRKLYADASESITDLITEATSELYNLIDKNIDEVIFRKTATPEEIEKFDEAAIEAEIKAEQRPVASLGKNGTIIAVAILILAVALCILLGFKLGGYFVGSSDIPEDSVLQSGSNYIGPTLSPATGESQSEQFTLHQTDTLPSGSDTGITVFNSVPESTTSIFDPNVTLTNPPPQTNYNPIHYDPPATQAPQRQEPETTAPTTAPTTEKPTEKPTAPTTEKPTETTTDDGMVHGEM